MKPKLCCSALSGCMIGLLTTAGSLEAAVELSLSPPEQTVQAGVPFSLALKVAGLGNGEAPSLSTFDLEVSYDSAALEFQAAGFGDPLLGDQLELVGPGAITEADSSLMDTVSLFELSLDSAADLNSLQASEFTLATLTFSGLTWGATPLSVSISALGDSDGFPLTADVLGATVTIVPEASTFALVSLGLLALATARRCGR